MRRGNAAAAVRRRCGGVKSLLLAPQVTNTEDLTPAAAGLTTNSDGSSP